MFLAGGFQQANQPFRRVPFVGWFLFLLPARAQQADSYPTEVTTRTFAGAGSALPLERSAADVRAAVLRWLK